MGKAGKKSICDESSHKDCPVFLTLSLIANKWSVQILYYLMQANKSTLRFSELQKQLNGITQRELTKHLREFEKTGIVTRTVFPQIPPRVEYTLSDMGHSLFIPIKALAQWAEKHGPTIQKKREDFERRAAKKSGKQAA
ncbi:MAG: helix-turn-helix domain-containing protein [Rickettsiales bacterium]|nr:helix-turn-helix domain-containing protein [Rickettsiales bacterium]